MEIAYLKPRPYVVIVFALFATTISSILCPESGQTAPPNFVSEVLITNLTEPIVMQFLPGGRMLIVGRLGTIWVAQPGATQIDPTPFLQLTNISNNSSENGVFSITLDPNFAQNQNYYVFYTCASPLADRVSRFTATGNTTNVATETVIWQDTDVPGVTHHGGSIGFGPDGNLYISTGEHFIPNLSQQLDTFRGKILRMRSDGTAPSDNPFYLGTNQPRDYIWALGLRNPFRMSFDQQTGRLYIADVGGNNQSTAMEEVNLGAAGANYGWPICEGPCPDPNVTDPLFSYAHSGQHASITGGFVYRGTQFPTQYRGSYFYGDFVRNFIKGITLDASGQVTGTFNFEPANGTSNGPYGNIAYLTEGPDGALYYVDYNFDASGNQTSPGSVRRIRFTAGNQPPNVVASANPMSGPAPLSVNFSSAGTLDPENDPLTYSWDFGDGMTSTQPSPAHPYQNNGRYTARLTVSDGNSSVISNPINIVVGNPPVALISSPTNGAMFVAHDVITFSGSAFDPDNGPLPPSALSWLIVFHHGSHTHPILGPVGGVSSGTYTIPSTGHDYSGQTSYEIILIATDADGLQNSSSVVIFPQKVNLTFNTIPSGLDLFVDGVRTTTPLQLDTLIGFVHTLQAIDQTSNGVPHTFLSWSDGGAQTHSITTPNTNQTYTASYIVASQSSLLNTNLNDLASVQNPIRGTGAGASVTTTPANDFVPGHAGNGIRINAANENARFLETSGGIQNVELDRGTADFWYIPSSVHTDGVYRPLVSIGPWAAAGSIHIRKHNGSNKNVLGVTCFDASGSRTDTDVAATNYSFTPGTPVNIRITWDFTVGPSVKNIHIYLNGVEATPVYFSSGPKSMPAESATRFIFIGHRGDTSGFHGNGVFDELVIYPTAIPPGQQDVIPPQPSNGQPTGALSAGTTSTTISLTTNEAASCRYSTTPGVAFSAMSNVFSTTGGTSHSTLVTGLSNGGSYTYYCRCQDSAGNSNTNDFNIGFTVNSATVVPGLIAAYGFNEVSGNTTADLSGNGNTATISGATRTAGRYGNGLSFDGVNDYVAGTDIDFPSGPFTLSTWYNTSVIKQSYLMGKFTTTQNRIYIMISSTGAAVAGLYDGTWRDVVDTNLTADGNWHHLALVASATQIELFIDGVSRATAPHNNTFPVNNALWNFGRRNNNSLYFNGVLDEIRMYNRALTQAEIQTVMQTPL